MAAVHSVSMSDIMGKPLFDTSQSLLRKLKRIKNPLGHLFEDALHWIGLIAGIFVLGAVGTIGWLWSKTKKSEPSGPNHLSLVDRLLKQG
jgi:hypothetical protein